MACSEWGRIARGCAVCSWLVNLATAISPFAVLKPRVPVTNSPGPGTHAHVPVRVVATVVRPVALTEIVRSWLPGDGVARHNVSAAAVVPTPVGWNATL